MKRFALSLVIMIAAFAQVQAQFCCDDELTTKLCRLQSELTSCCEDLQGTVDEIVSKVPCTPFIEINVAPYTITTSGKYCFTADLLTDASVGITIAPGVNNVLIDFNNHSLTLTARISVGISSDNNSNIVILNPVIHTKIEGGALSFTNSKNIVVERPLLDSSPIGRSFYTGIFISNSSNVTVYQPSIFTTAPESVGFSISGSANITILGGSIRNIATAVFCDSTINSRILGLAATESIAGNAVILQNSSSNCLIERCIVKAGINGLQISSSNNCFIKQSSIQAVQNGVSIVTSNFNSIEDCLIQNANIGVNLSGTSNANAIIGCTIRNTSIITTPVRILNSVTNTLIRNTNYNQPVVDSGTGTVEFNNQQF